MADPGALRQRRHKQHAAGDHSLCRPGCGKVPPGRPKISVIAGGSGKSPGPAARLQALADRLEAAHEEDPGNAMLARELRVTLLALADGGAPPAEDAVDRIRRDWESGG